MWTKENRRRYDRSKLRYPSDLTDEEWEPVAPLIPPANRDGLMYILSTGCQWRAIPKDLPPRSTLFDYLELWSWDGTLDRIHHALYAECRDREGHEASPSAAIIDSQSVKSAEKGGFTIRTATMRARKSRARSATFSLTRLACCCTLLSMRPTCRTATVRSLFWTGRPAPCCHSFFVSSLMPAIRERVRRALQPIWAAGLSKSLNAAIMLWALRFCPSAGSSSARSPGSIAAEGSPKTGNASIERRSPSSA